MMLLVCGNFDSCRREREETVLSFSVLSVQWNLHMCLHGSQRIQDIHLSGTVSGVHLVNCDFSFVSDGRHRSTFRFQIV